MSRISIQGDEWRCNQATWLVCSEISGSGLSQAGCCCYCESTPPGDKEALVNSNDTSRLGVLPHLICGLS